MNHVVVSASRKAWGKNARAMRIFVLRLLTVLRVRHTTIEIYLIDVRVMRRLNRRFRAKDAPTTILSFGVPQSFIVSGQKNTQIFLGELYLAPTYIAQKGESEEALVIHGVLHLIGYTHAGKHDTMVMERTERKLHAFLKGS